jgi:hypothetical protein
VSHWFDYAPQLVFVVIGWLLARLQNRLDRRADRRQEEADRLQSFYSDLERAIGNALTGIRAMTGVRLQHEAALDNRQYDQIVDETRIAIQSIGTCWLKEHTHEADMLVGIELGDLQTLLSTTWGETRDSPPQDPSDSLERMIAIGSQDQQVRDAIKTHLHGLRARSPLSYRLRLWRYEGRRRWLSAKKWKNRLRLGP